MAAYYLQSAPPWSGLQEEDRRFWLILAAVLTVFFVIGYVVPSLQLPKVEPAWETVLPPRLARIIEEGIEPASRSPAPEQPATQKPVTAPRPEPETAAVSTPDEKETATVTTPVATSQPERENAPASTPEVDKAAAAAAARKKASSAGVLALSDSLTELRKTVPKIATAKSASSTDDAGGQAIVRRPSVLTEDVARVSGGIEGETVDHQKVLGASSLQARPTTGDGGPIEGTSTSRAAPETSGTQRRSVRSEEEIQEILDRHKSAIYMIYSRELTKDPDLQGKVVVSITIAPSGQVTACRVIYSDLNAASLEEKLVLLIRQIDFGAKAGIPVVTTRVPIEFFPV